MNKLKRVLTSRFFMAMIVGALCSLAFAPFHFVIAAIISISSFYFLLEKEEEKKRVFWLGWSYGFGYFLTGVYWITISLLVDAQQFAWLIPFAITLIPGVLAIYIGSFALVYKAFIKKCNLSQGYQRIIAFAIIWIIFEILRSFLFTGFPWNLLGYIWLFSDHLAQSASLISVWGLSFLAILFCLVPTLFVQLDHRKVTFKKMECDDKIFGTILFLLFILNFFYGLYRIDDKKIVTDSTQNLLLVQGNIQQDMKWDAQQKYDNFIKHIDITRSSDLRDVNMVIWSETAVPYAIGDNDELLETLAKAVPTKGSLVTGALRVKTSDFGELESVWNSVFAIDKQGVVGYYDKHHLVPFGEYVPLQEYLPFISKITNGALGFSEGEGPKTVDTGSLTFSPLLCYEVIFPDKIIDKNHRPDLLINLTNDAWFGRSSGPYQHFDMAKMRAIEYGISLARVANTGITAFFDPFGRVVNQIDLNQQGVMKVSHIKPLEPTIYSKYGFYPLIILVLIFFIISIPRKKNVVRQSNSS